MLYNENDPKVAAWLRELIARGHLPGGLVDERSIEEIAASECQETSHFFAGIGGWPLALRLAGWPAASPVWTGSCPCQPFSAAGRRRGHEDARHLWPVWFRLIAERRPPVVFGEQVASGDGRRWLAGVRADLETLGYAVGAADLCAAGVGAPHIRQRLYWVADAGGEERRGLEALHVRRRGPDEAAALNAWAPVRLGDADKPGSQRRGLLLADGSRERASGQAGPAFIECADGQTRRVESGVHPLAHGVPARVVRLRGYGNAVVPQVAAMFVTAFMEGSDR